jgi:hypothetical protein
MRSVYVGLALAATFLGASCVSARPVRVWKDAELWSEAEVVVLAMPRATKDVVARADDPRPDYWVDVETTLDVQVVLKGEAGGEVTLRHARYRDGTMPLPNGPMFVKLDPEKRQQFLLFLKRAKDGTLEPLSGQMDAHDSVRWVQPFGAIR